MNVLVGGKPLNAMEKLLYVSLNNNFEVLSMR